MARRPKDEDLPTIISGLYEGKSLRAMCRELGLSVWATSEWLRDDPGRGEQYARAKEGRADYFQEEILTVGRAVSFGIPLSGSDGSPRQIDPAGARVYLDAIKWANGQMMSHKEGKPIRIRHEFGDVPTDELEAQAAALIAKATGAGADDESSSDS